MTLINLEVCSGSIQSALAASEGGAKRIELCSALSEGGLTPSIGLIKKAKSVPDLKVFVLIRPRTGDFLYTPDEIEIMEKDVKAAVEAGADGIVIGALTAEGEIDTDTCRKLIAIAKKINPETGVTFHRAFDVCKEPEKAIETIIDLGCDRILTSGCAQNAMEGVDMLQKLVNMANGRISIMAGGGVSAENASVIVKKTGVKEIHASARSTYKSRMKFINRDVNMGNKGIDEYSLQETDSEKVSAIISSLNSID